MSPDVLMHASVDADMICTALLAGCQYCCNNFCFYKLTTSVGTRYFCKKNLVSVSAFRNHTWRIYCQKQHSFINIQAYYVRKNNKNQK